MGNIFGIYITSMYLLYSLMLCDARIICSFPNKCVDIKKCKPFYDIYIKGPNRTIKEYELIKISMCNFNGSTFDVCCPYSILRQNRISKQTPILAPPKRQPEAENTQIKYSNNYENPGYYQGHCGVEFVTKDKIYGGADTSIGEYPWMVILEYRNQELNCGGSLITAKLVLTAGHCVVNTGGKPKFVRLAEYDLTTYPIDTQEVDGGGHDNITNIKIPVRKTIAYPSYRSHSGYNDIGIVVMAYDVNFTEFVQPICLPLFDSKEFEKSINFTFAGWGVDKDSYQVNIKSSITIPHVPNSICRDMWNDIYEEQICAGGVNDKDTCYGDSGGPLMYEIDTKYYVVGVLSYGREICGTPEPAVYTNVHKYLLWINSMMELYS